MKYINQFRSKSSKFSDEISTLKFSMEQKDNMLNQYRGRNLQFLFETKNFTFSLDEISKLTENISNIQVQH